MMYDFTIVVWRSRRNNDTIMTENKIIVVTDQLWWCNNDMWYWYQTDAQNRNVTLFLLWCKRKICLSLHTSFTPQPFHTLSTYVAGYSGTLCSVCTCRLASQPQLGYHWVHTYSYKGAHSLCQGSRPGCVPIMVVLCCCSDDPQCDVTEEKVPAG